MKINFDGAVFKNEGLAGLGVIIQNDKGLVMATSSQTIPLPTSIEMVELLAARSALYLARELQFDQVIVEGDSELEIKKLNSKDYSSTSFGHVIRDIKIASSAFRNFVFSHIRRQGNKVAHRLARLACNFPTFYVWMEGVPPATIYQSELV